MILRAFNLSLLTVLGLLSSATLVVDVRGTPVTDVGSTQGKMEAAHGFNLRRLTASVVRRFHVSAELLRGLFKVETEYASYDLYGSAPAIEGLGVTGRRSFEKLLQGWDLGGGADRALGKMPLLAELGEAVQQAQNTCARLTAIGRNITRRLLHR